MKVVRLSITAVGVNAIGQPPDYHVHATAILGIVLLLILIGHAVLGLLRNLRDFRNGH